MEKILAVIYRLAFVTALAVAALAIAEGFAQLLGQTITHGTYSAGRLFELSGILMIFVIALLLRDIRDNGKRTRG